MTHPKHIIYLVAHQEGNHGNYVVHRKLIGHYEGGELELNYLTGMELSAIRKEMKARGLRFEDRCMSDDVKIVEKWM